MRLGRAVHPAQLYRRKAFVLLCRLFIHANTHTATVCMPRHDDVVYADFGDGVHQGGHTARVGKLELAGGEN